MRQIVVQESKKMEKYVEDRWYVRMCTESAIVHRERNKEGMVTGRWICISCWHRSLRCSRTGNLNPNCSRAKGNKFQKLSNRSKNEKFDRSKHRE